MIQLRRHVAPEPEASERTVDDAARGTSRARSSYRAFISYSHAADGKLAPALQAALHHFAKPWYKLRAIRVFRDEASLAANPALWTSIEQALGSSEWFVLLASPQAAASEWVGKEVGFWLEHKPLERFLIGLTAGEIAWDEGTQDFDWTRTDALPRVLAGAFAQEPRYIDLRWARTAEDVSLRSPVFRSSVAEIAAPLHGVPKDELIGEDVRQHRRTVRIARGAGTALALLAVAATVLAFLALDQRNTARAQRDRAEREARIAMSQRVSQLAVDMLGRRLAIGILLTLEAYRTEPTPEARSAIVDVLERTQRTRSVIRSAGDFLSVTYTADGKRLLTTDGEERVRLWSLADNRQVGKTMHCYCLTTTTGAALTPDGRRVLSAYGFDSTAITIWDATTGRNVGELTDPNGSVAGVAVSGDGRFFVSFGEDPDVRPVTLWDLRRRSRIANFPTRGSTSVAAFAPRSSILAVSDESGVVLWNARTRHRLGELPGQTTAMSLAFTGDGRTLAVGTEGGTIRLWNTSTRKAFGRALVPQSWVMGLAFSPDGRVLLSSDDEGMVRLWDVGNRSLIERIRGHLRFVNSVAIAPDGTSFASAGQDGTVRIWHGGAHPLASPIQGASDAGEPTFDPESRRLALDVGNGSTRVLRVSDGRTAAVLPGASKGSTWALAWSPDGRRLATSDEDGSVSVWDVASRKRLKRFHRSTLRRAVDVAFAPDGKVLAAIWQDGSVAFFDAHKLKWLSDPLDADQILTGLAFVDGGATLATVGSDLLFWDVARHRVRKRVEIKVTGIDAIAAAPGGELLALGGDDGRIRLWRTHGGRVGEPLVGHSDEGISDLAFSPNGRLLASGGVDGTFRLWDAGARRPIGGPITVAFGSPSVDFSGDGQYLASSTDGGAAFVDPLVWRGDLRGYTQRLCPIAGRSLNRAEWREFLPGIPYRRTCG